jgi:hypothetical protein
MQLDIFSLGLASQHDSTSGLQLPGRCRRCGSRTMGDWEAGAGFFIPTGIFLPLPSGKGIPERYKWYTAYYRSNSNSKQKTPIQTVTSGIPRYK